MKLTHTGLASFVGGHRRGDAPSARSATRWRLDRVATVLVPGTDRLQVWFVGVAKPLRCRDRSVFSPAAEPQRVVESAIHYIAQRWWHTTVVRTVDTLYQQLRGSSRLPQAGGSFQGPLQPARPSSQRWHQHTEFRECLLRVEVEATEQRCWNSRMRFANFRVGLGLRAHKNRLEGPPPS